ncbi:hypothetical protein E5163_04570 [Marinicauda algicola]|uniref:Uncharacterized protein n=1 Tax=Marinicauda algicola TaxID=2029849 RepID=A0A4S2H4R3_9PROT|nr:hypothetical protein [Marinicauda algicola]TGY90401.1 hypothetical protein E5163_04570 [Marinicauda algicola]
MRYVLILMGVAALGVGALVCPQAVRSEVIAAVSPDPALSAEIDSAIQSLIEQLDRMSPEFAPGGRI